MSNRLKQKPVNVLRVVVYGPECTGKTTLASQLAYHYQTVWVPEYARDYLQEKWNDHRQVCEHEDLLPIAYGQMRLENKLAVKADKVLICDTDLLETKVYAEKYYDGKVDPLLDAAAGQNQYDLYLVTYIDVPWEFDSLREWPNQREDMFRAFENALKENNRPYVILKGDRQTRFKRAVAEIDKILEQRKKLHSYSDSENIVAARRKSFFSKFFNFGT